MVVMGATGLVGGVLTGAARREGHQVVALSRIPGPDVLGPRGLAEALDGAEVVVDVLRSPSADETDASVFFARAAQRLGQAAHHARVKRTVVLSLIGADAVSASSTGAGTGSDGYYSATYVHERATVLYAPGPRIVRSAQLHDLARELADRGEKDTVVPVPDLLIQPVAVEAMVGVLLRVATGDVSDELTEVAGPRRERLAPLVTAVARRRGSTLVVVPKDVGDLVNRGILLPRADAVLTGPDFDSWLRANVAPGRPAGPWAET